MSKKPFNFGSPEENNAFYEELISTFDEVPDHWHIGRKFPRLTSEEFTDSFDAIERLLRKYGSVGFGKTDDLYLDDRMLGDRTHRIDVLRSDRMPVTCLEELKQMLSQLFPLWRILVVFADGKRKAVWVYPDTLVEDDEGN